MKWIIVLTILSLIGFILLLRKGIKAGKEIDENSPENIDVDKILKVVLLRKKLKQIEEEREL